VSVRLAPDSSVAAAGVNAKTLRPLARLVSRVVIRTKGFYLKPVTSTVKLGGTVSFTAYATVAVRETFISGKAVAARAVSGQAVTDDDELVPLWSPPTSPATTKVRPVDDDELVGLTYTYVYVREYPFKNTKNGFLRLWSTSGPGSISGDGVFTAPTDVAAKGKTATVLFVSTNVKTVEIARASGTVKIEGGPKAYRVSATRGNGTVSGTICDRSKPFSLALNVTGATPGSWEFVPSGDTTGSSSFNLSYVGGSITDSFTGTYTFTDSADGNTDTLRSVGVQNVTIPTGGTVQKSLDETFPLIPIAACTP
jgi:hypothetical protein